MGNCCTSGDTKPKAGIFTANDGNGSYSNGHAARSILLEDDEDWLNDEWHDALEFHHDDPADDAPAFEVTPEEILTLEKTLAEKFPEDSNYMSEAYLQSVASKPYSKNPKVRRPLDYTLQKLIQVMEWRRDNKAAEMPEWVRLCTLSPQEAADQATSKEQLKTAQQMVNSLNNGSMYWHGHTKEGRPILWIRTDRKFWYPNVTAEVQALIVMADAGIQYGMPNGVTDFCVVSDSHSPPPPNPQFAFGMLQGLVKGYPDRMYLLVSAPVSSIVEFCMNLLLPLMPGRLPRKFCFYNLENVQERLKTMLLHGEDDIPSFFGGPNKEHDEYYPKSDACPLRGAPKSSLKFDWYGMVERLKKQKQQFEEEKSHF